MYICVHRTYLVGLGVVAGEEDGGGEAEGPEEVEHQLVDELHRRFLRKVDVRLPGKGNSNLHGARPVHQIMARGRSTKSGEAEGPEEAEHQLVDELHRRFLRNTPHQIGPYATRLIRVVCTGTVTKVVSNHA